MMYKVLSFAILSSVFFSSCKDDDDDAKNESINNQEISDETINVDYTISGTVGEYPYVDLGLESGTLWATYNVGASKVIEKGYQVRWGEIAGSTGAEYKWSNDSCKTFTKYVMDSKYGTVDSLSTLEPADDIATVSWGADWRMPTATELQELEDGCDWKWVDYPYGDDSKLGGYLGVSKVNGNKIFFPSTWGYVMKTVLGVDCGGQCVVYGPEMDYRLGYYWSSSLDENNSETVFRYNFYAPSSVMSSSAENTRDEYGCVRAVRNGK